MPPSFNDLLANHSHLTREVRDQLNHLREELAAAHEREVHVARQELERLRQAVKTDPRDRAFYDQLDFRSLDSEQTDAVPEPRRGPNEGNSSSNTLDDVGPTRERCEGRQHGEPFAWAEVVPICPPPPLANRPGVQPSMAVTLNPGPPPATASRPESPPGIAATLNRHIDQDSDLDDDLDSEASDTRSEPTKVGIVDAQPTEQLSAPPNSHARRPSKLSAGIAVGADSARRPSKAGLASRMMLNAGLSDYTQVRRPSAMRDGMQAVTSRNASPSHEWDRQNSRETGDQHVFAWPIWQEMLDDSAQAGGTLARKTQQVVTEQQKKMGNMKTIDFQRVQHSDFKVVGLLQSLVVTPNSLTRIAFISLGITMISYDLVMVPFYSSFTVPDLDSGQQIASLIIACGWTIEFFHTFLVGYHEEGVLEMTIQRTASRYVSTWMPLDLSLIVLDWSLIIFDHMIADEAETAGTLRVMKVARASRSLRTLRLIRLVKLPNLVKEATDNLGRSESASLTSGLFKHFVLILLMNHYIACAWHLVGKADDGWVQHYSDTSLHWSVNSWWTLYVTSLHWSLTQCTPASMAVQPQNMMERTFNVAVILFAIMTYSSFTGSITQMMTHLRSLRSAEKKQEQKLDRYLYDHTISVHLAWRVRRYVEHITNEMNRRPPEKDVEMLDKLSEPLRQELHFEIFNPLLSRHAFFAHYSLLNQQAMMKVCHTALKPIQLSEHDVLFAKGEAADAMFWVVHGRLSYTREMQRPEAVVDGHSICEMALWCYWEYRGQLRATVQARLLSLDAKQFHTIVLTNRTASPEAAAYALEAVDRVNNAGLPAEELTDLDSEAFNPARLAVKAFGELETEKDEKRRWRRGMSNFLGKSPTKVLGITRNSDAGKVRPSNCSADGDFDVRMDARLTTATTTSCRDPSK